MNNLKFNSQEEKDDKSKIEKEKKTPLTSFSELFHNKFYGKGGYRGKENIEEDGEKKYFNQLENENENENVKDVNNFLDTNNLINLRNSNDYNTTNENKEISGTKPLLIHNSSIAEIRKEFNQEKANEKIQGSNNIKEEEGNANKNPEPDTTRGLMSPSAVIKRKLDYGNSKRKTTIEPFSKINKPILDNSLLNPKDLKSNADNSNTNASGNINSVSSKIKYRNSKLRKTYANTSQAWKKRLESELNKEDFEVDCMINKEKQDNPFEDEKTQKEIYDGYLSKLKGMEKTDKEKKDKKRCNTIFDKRSSQEINDLKNSQKSNLRLDRPDKAKKLRTMISKKKIIKEGNYNEIEKEKENEETDKKLNLNDFNSNLNLETVVEQKITDRSEKTMTVSFKEKEVIENKENKIKRTKNFHKSNEYLLTGELKIMDKDDLENENFNTLYSEKKNKIKRNRSEKKKKKSKSKPKKVKNKLSQSESESNSNSKISKSENSNSVSKSKSKSNIINETEEDKISSNEFLSSSSPSSSSSSSTPSSSSKYSRKTLEANENMNNSAEIENYRHNVIEIVKHFDSYITLINSLNQTFNTINYSIQEVKKNHQQYFDKMIYIDDRLALLEEKQNRIEQAIGLADIVETVPSSKINSNKEEKEKEKNKKLKIKKECEYFDSKETERD